MPSAGPILPPVRTVPALLRSAAERDPGGVWIRSDDTELTFAAVVAAVAGVAARLRDAGVRRATWWW
jgi:non-ribosomal peptide synthetase component E (peptide arylation enzyme)